MQVFPPARILPLILLSLTLLLPSLHAAKDEEEEEDKGSKEPATQGETVKLDPSRNILWDAGFDTGFGNGFWTVVGGNQGPSLRSMWNDGVINLQIPIASRCYRLPEGNYTLCAWVKRNPKVTTTEGQVQLRLTNLNYYREKKSNDYSKKFPVAPGDQWQRVGWTFSIEGAIRPNFHVEIRGDDGILVDCVSLMSGTNLPDKPLFAADMEAGFDIADETRTYVDGENRLVDFMVVNHTNKPIQTKARWEMYDHREDLVKSGVLNEELAAGKVLRKPIPVDDLTYGGYRLASSVEGQNVLGDGLLGILPVVSQKSFPYVGLEASYSKTSANYTVRLLKKLGITQANLLSCSGAATRWGYVEPEKGQYKWLDEGMLPALDSDTIITPYLSFSYGPPKWAATMLEGDYRNKLHFKEEKAFIDAYCSYVDTYIRHYKGRIPWIMLEDEVHHGTDGQNVTQLIKLYSAAYATAKKASAEMGNPNLLVGIDATGAGWWANFLSKVPKDQLDLVSSNTAHQPAAAAEVLNTLRKSGLAPEIYQTGGVGQRGPIRKTSMSCDRGGAGNPAGIFAGQALLHAWMSRPYGTENPKDGPMTYCGFYDQRTLAQTAYLPFAGKTGVEFDNSPGVGWLAMTMFKHNILGMRPVRDPSKPYSTEGVPTGAKNLFAYPFRSDKEAAVVLCTSDLGNLESKWTMNGLEFKDLKLRDMFSKPIPIHPDGSITVRDLPIYLSTSPDKLEELIKKMPSLKASTILESNAHKLEAGPYSIEIDPSLEGYIRLWRTDNGKRKLIIDRLMVQESMGKPEISANVGRLDSSAGLRFGGRNGGGLNIKLTADGCQFTWGWRNVFKKESKATIRLRVAQEGAGSHMTIQEGNAVKSGKVREDYGDFAGDATPPPAAKIPKNASRVTMDGFATFDLSASSGKNFSPDTGFLWKTQDGQAFLESSYVLNPMVGKGAGAAPQIEMSVYVK